MSGHHGDIVGQFDIGTIARNPSLVRAFKGIGLRESISAISLPTIVKTTSTSALVFHRFRCPARVDSRRRGLVLSFRLPDCPVGGE